jgi:hypothetical protein
MAGFKTHISTSTTLGVAYGCAAYSWYGAPWESSILAGALCSVSGMLPDLDSDTGTPLKESLAFGSACISMMLMERFRSLDVNHETMVLAGVVGYIVMRFGIGWVLKSFTVHRGMFHSLPACAIAAEAAFLMATGDLDIRLFKAAGVVLGFMSHLVLDEIWSIDVMKARIKSSFGTAIKFFGDSPVANLCTYGLLAMISVLVFHDPIWINSPPQTQQLHQLANTIFDAVLR